MLIGLAATLADGAAPIDIKCGHHTKLLQFLVESLGYPTRWVNVFTDTDPALPMGHVFLGVRNPETDRWEATDANMNVYYALGAQRLGVEELLSLDYDEYEPCNETGCGWSVSDARAYALREFDILKAALIIEGRERYMYLSDRFDRALVFAKLGQAVEEFFGRHWPERMLPQVTVR
jgi:hypothetical protein